MSAQTSYEINQPVAYAGQVYANHAHEIISLLAEGVIAFGVAVGRGTDAARQAVAGLGTGYQGVAIRSLEREGAINTGDITYKDKEAVGVMKTGWIWAVCPAGCTPGQAVKFTDASGVLDQGAPGAGETAISGATWETTTAAGQIGLIRLPSE